jgi:uncharacterized protein (DUF488 family)
LYTIGHSNNSVERFIELLCTYSITAVCDVRSSPYSKFVSQFNRDQLQNELKKYSIAYVFLGRELGARPTDPQCYVDGKVQYERLAQTALFKQGITRVRNGMQAYTIALMCAEGDPINCHRTILICRYLRSNDIEIKHILQSAEIESLHESERRLMQLLKIPEKDLFSTTDELIELAYDIQSKKIGFSVDDDRLETLKEGKHE